MMCNIVHVSISGVDLGDLDNSMWREGMYGELDTQSYIVAVCQRLQINVRNKWTRRTTDNLQEVTEYLSFSDSVKFVSAEDKRQNDPIFGQDLSTHQRNFNSQVDRRIRQHHVYHQPNSLLVIVISVFFWS